MLSIRFITENIDLLYKRLKTFRINVLPAILRSILIRRHLQALAAAPPAYFRASLKLPAPATLIDHSPAPPFYYPHQKPY
jgi:hypothetical protein